MTKKLLTASLVDGLINGVTFSLLLEFVISVYAKDLTFSDCVVICVLCVFFTTITLYLILPRSCNGKMIIGFAGISSCSFVTIFIIDLLLPFRMFSMHGQSAGDGIYLIIFTCIYITLSLILRLGCLILKITRRTLRTGDQ